MTAEMPLVLVRVDDRLIHGQVVAVWLRHLPARRIVVVDDATARDGLLSEVLRMAAPSGVTVEVLDLERAVERLATIEEDPEPAYVLVRTPLTALGLRERGVEFETLNVGSLGMAPGRRRVHRSVSASDAELDALRRLEALGVRVVLQAVPGDRRVTLTSALAAR